MVTFYMIIDHHDYSVFQLNRDKNKSSLEQFSALIEYKLNRKEKVSFSKAFLIIKNSS